MFTSQHFKKIAEVFRAVRPVVAEFQLPNTDWAYTVEKMADVFALDNPRFDRERFLRKCGLTK